MSSFFGKEQTEKNLQYDDIAFLHFLASICGVISIVLAISVISSCYQKKGKPWRKLQKTGIFKEQILNSKKIQGAFFKSHTIIWRTILLILMILIIAGIGYFVRSSGNEMINFDPYEILGVEYDTPVSKIKKAYRKLALQYHPDRNKNNPENGAKFIMISKAYECLTDETKKQNCVKYGNPDGGTSFELGIGLPSFVIDKKNQVYVLPFVFFFLLIVIPLVFIKWNNSLRAKDQRNGLLVSNYSVLYNLFHPNFQFSDALFAFSSLKEINNISEYISAQRKEAIKNKLSSYKFINIDHLFVVPLYCLPTIQRMTQHLTKQKTDYQLARVFQQQFHKLLQFATYYCKLQNRGKCLFDNQEWTIEFYGVKLLQTVVDLPRKFYNQLFSQQIKTPLQLLDLNQQQIQMVRSDPILNLVGVILENQQKIDNYIERFQPERRQFIKTQLQNLPMAFVDFRLFINKKQVQEIPVNDVVTVQFRIGKRNKTTGFCSLKNFPYLKEQTFYFIVNKQQQLVNFQIVKLGEQGQYIGKFQYQQNTPGQVELIARVVSDCYYGLDYMVRLKLNIVSNDQEQGIQLNKQDLLIQKFPKTLVESLFSLDMDNSDKQMSDQEQQGEEKQRFTTLMNTEPRKFDPRPYQLILDKHREDQKQVYDEDEDDDCCSNNQNKKRIKKKKSNGHAITKRNNQVRRQKELRMEEQK